MFEFIPHFDDEPLGCLLADAGDFAEEARVRCGNRSLKSAHFNVADDRRCRFWPNPGERDESFKEISLFFVQKGVKGVRIFSHDVGEIEENRSLMRRQFGIGA